MNPDRDVRLWLFTRAEVATAVDGVFEAFDACPSLSPDRVGPFEPYGIEFPGAAARDLWRAEAERGVGMLGGKRKGKPGIRMTVSFGIVPRRRFHTLFWTAEDELLKKPGAAEQIEDLFRRLAVALDAYWGAVFHSEDFERQNVLLDWRGPDGSVEPYAVRGVDPACAVPGLYWLNYFGPTFCDFVGMAALEATAPETEALGEGRLLKLADSPEETLHAETRERAAELRRALGEDLFFDIADPERATRAPSLSDPTVPPPPEPPPLPSIPDPEGFVQEAPQRAAAWRLRHGIGEGVDAAVSALESHLDALELQPPSEEALGDFAAVLGELVIERSGGRWITGEEPRVVTDDGREAYPVSQVFKRAVDPEASLADWIEAAAAREPRP